MKTMNRIARSAAFLSLFALGAAACARSTPAASTTTTVAYQSSSGASADLAATRAPVANHNAPMNCEEATVYFESGSDRLDDSAQQRLVDLTRCMQARGAHELVVTGHADPRGDAESNRSLGMRRANNVAGYLRARGIDDPQISIRTVGEAGQSGDPQRYPFSRSARVEVSNPQP